MKSNLELIINSQRLNLLNSYKIFVFPSKNIKPFNVYKENISSISFLPFLFKYFKEGNKQNYLKKHYD